MYEQVHCGDEAASHQLPIAAAFCIISFHGDMFKLNAKFDADLLFCWLSLFECNGHIIHMLTQLESTVKLS